MKHNTLESAVKSDSLDVPIPSSFVHMKEDSTRQRITIGIQSNNENLQAGQSSTQFPKEYVFKTSSATICMIDTPGIGDVRGTRKDKENLDNILAFLLKYEQINAVCVLLKPNNS